MKYRAMIGASALALLLAVGPCGATEFCGSGREGIPDRPCEEDLANALSVAAKYESKWESISGVSNVDASRSGSTHEIVVGVEPASLANSVKEVLPSEVEGYRVRIVAIDPETESGETENIEGARLASNHHRYGTISPCTSADQAEDNSTADVSVPDIDTSAYDEVLSDPDTESWLDLPGVLSIGPQKCGDCDCVPLQVVVTVQAAMLESLRPQLPTRKFGVPIVLVPALQGRPIDEGAGFGGFVR